MDLYVNTNDKRERTTKGFTDKMVQTFVGHWVGNLSKLNLYLGYSRYKRQNSSVQTTKRVQTTKGCTRQMGTHDRRVQTLHWTLSWETG